MSTPQLDVWYLAEIMTRALEAQQRATQQLTALDVLLRSIKEGQDAALVDLLNRFWEARQAYKHLIFGFGQDAEEERDPQKYEQAKREFARLGAELATQIANDSTLAPLMPIVLLNENLQG